MDNSLETKSAGLLALAFAAGCAMAALLGSLVNRAWWAPLLALPLAAPFALIAARHVVRPWTRMLRALEAAVASYREGDFSVSLISDRDDELGHLLRAQNEFAQAVREERRDLAQRELLLDTVVQNTPVALVLVDSTQRVMFANLAARQLFNAGMGLEGLDFAAVLAHLPRVASELADAGEDALFTATIDGTEESFHLSQRRFSLQGRAGCLYLFRRMTRELSRQEVAIWKKVIRVVTHELNNSLAPISSMAHSGAELARRAQDGSLAQIFAAIRERALHLHSFIDGYARLAKLPAPRPRPTQWPEFIAGLAQQIDFHVPSPLPAQPGTFDPVQIEQVLINLIKNAHESGSAPEEVQLSVQHAGGEFHVEVADRGSGMNEAALANALLPFYSTKREGTGLGLALAREVVEAHGGSIQLANRNGGGTRVLLKLPGA